MRLGHPHPTATYTRLIELRVTEKATGIASNQLSRLERCGKSKMITFAMVVKLTRLYGVSADEIADQAFERRQETRETQAKGRVLHGR